MSDQKPTAAERIKAQTDKRNARNATEARAREEQLATDLEAIAVLEEDKGVRIYYSSQVRNYVAGQPVIVGIRAPSEGEYKRLFSKMNNTKGHSDAKVAAHVELADVVWMYPQDPSSRRAMIEANAGLLASVGNFATKLAEVDVEEEGKG